MTTSKRIGLILSLLALFATSANAQRYILDKTISIGGSGGWDYVTIDQDARRLYASHDMQVVVVDIDKDAVVGSIQNTEGVHGIAIAHAEGKGFISCGRTSTVLMFDLASMDTLKRITVGQKPDAIIYEPFSHAIFVFNGKSEDCTVLDATTGNVKGTIALGGGPEFACSDLAGHVYVNLEEQNQCLQLDVNTLAVVQRWSVAPGEGPSGMAIDNTTNKLFIGCANKKMIIIDYKTGKVVADRPIGSGIDAVVFDNELRHAISSNGEGNISLVTEDVAGTKFVAKNIPTRKGARTEALDEKTHALYLPTAEFGPAPEATAEHPHPRPSIKPESFVVLKYRYAK